MSRFRWGVLGTGPVARKFVLGLRHLPNVDVSVVASRHERNAARFAAELDVPRAAPSYAAAAADRDVDAVYVATPASHHVEHALLALEAGKPTLVEKPFATDAVGARTIAEAAAASGVFCMEAMWTRFLPLVIQLREQLASGSIGEPRFVSGSFGIAEHEDRDASLFDPARGGGALLQRGIYPVYLACLLLGSPEAVLSRARRGPTGVDVDTVVTMDHGEGVASVSHSSLDTTTTNDLHIFGTEGSIHVERPIYRPFRYVLTPVVARRMPSDGGRLAAVREEPRVQRIQQRLSRPKDWVRQRLRGTAVTARYAGNGYHYEAAHVMDCLRVDKQESDLLPLQESVALMQRLDQARAQWAWDAGSS